MLTNPTLDQMQSLGLAGMASAYRELAEQGNNGQLSRDEWLGLMLDREAATRADKRLKNRIAAARLRFPEACIEDIDFAAPRGLDRRSTMALAQGQWLKAHENLILTGQTGTGKSWLACAFGRQAARLDHSVLYVRMPRLFEDLALARLDGRFPRLMDKLVRVQLLILDDWGTHSLADQQRLQLFEIIEERYRRKSTLITAQVPVVGRQFILTVRRQLPLRGGNSLSSSIFRQQLAEKDDELSRKRGTDSHGCIVETGAFPERSGAASRGYGGHGSISSQAPIGGRIGW